ncbi:MAG: hypothetical protein AAGA35_00785 [Patescibacteria group bacterium]
MMHYNVFVQIAIAIIAVVIGFTYVMPTFAEIRQVQDDIAELDRATAQVAEVNTLLADLVAQVSAVSADDRLSLIRFMPDTVDQLRVLRDIDTIAQESNVILEGLSVGDVTEGDSSTSNVVNALPDSFTSYRFDVEVTGTYESIKQFLLNLEQNDYPLHVYALNAAPAEAGEEGVSLGTDTMKMNLVVETYSRLVPEDNPAQGRL